MKRAAVALLGFLLAAAAAGQGLSQEVSIQARVLEVDRADLVNAGVLPASGGPDSSAVPGIVKAVSASAADALLNKPETKKLQDLQIAASPAKPTDVRISSRAPGAGDPADFVEAAILLNLTSRLSADQKMSIAVNGHVRLDAGRDAGEAIRPVFSSQTFGRTVDVAGGQSIVIAGFINNAERKTLRDMPSLQQTPLLNFVFSGEAGQRELAIVLTPRVPAAILAAAPAPAPTAPIAAAPPAPQPQPNPAPADAVQAQPNPTLEAKPAAKYTVQIAAFKTQAAADKLTAELSRRYRDIPARTVAAGPEVYRVQLGLLPDLRTATQLRAKLRNDGFSPIILPLD